MKKKTSSQFFVDEDFESTILNEQFEKTSKLWHEIKQSDLLAYIGLSVSSDQENRSNISLNTSLDLNASIDSNSLSVNELMINDEECLTLYDKRTGTVASIHFKSKIRAYDWYKKFFENGVQTRSWRISERDYLPDLDKTEPRYFSIMATENSSNTLTSMFRKIIKK